MPVFSPCSQRLGGEALNHRLPENHGIPKEPSPIFGHSIVGRLPSSGSARAHPRPTKRT
jgi:hypothetical protein